MTNQREPTDTRCREGRPSYSELHSRKSQPERQEPLGSFKGAVAPADVDRNQHAGGRQVVNGLIGGLE